MPQINAHVLKTAGVAFKTSYQAGLSKAKSEWNRVATMINSTTASNEYGWLGSFPQMRQWVGDRFVHGMKTHGYTLRNDDYELTLAVQRNDILDDNLGIYAPMFEGIGKSAGDKYDFDVFGTLNRGFTELCYDGQPFFDTEHPVLDENGNPYGVSNFDAGDGPAWFLMDDRQPLLPIILQKRQDMNFVAKDSPDDESVFWKKEFVYGVDGRHTTGFGFWQMIFASKRPLTPENYERASNALAEVKGDYGAPLGLKPTLLVVPTKLKAAAKRVLEAETGPNGETNIWRGDAEIFVSSWLAA